MQEYSPESVDQQVLKESAHIKTLRQGDTVRKHSLDSFGVEMNVREYANQIFLHDLAKEKETGFAFLSAKQDGNDLVYPFLKDAKWMASSPQEVHAPFSDYEEAFLTFTQFCHEGIAYEDLPQAIQEDAQQRDSQYLLAKMSESLSVLDQAGLVTLEQQEELSMRLNRHIDARAFQHHDITPWHIAQHEDDLFLVDAGWGTWSLWAYDIAYYLLEIIARSKRKEDAVACYKAVKELYKDHAHFDTLLDCALAYRGTRLAGSLVEHEEDQETAKRVLEYTLEINKLMNA